jgi:hypothetical protein
MPGGYQPLSNRRGKTMTKTESTTAVVSNVGAVCALLNSFELDVKVEVKADAGGVKGTIRFADEDGCPAAVPRKLLPDPDEGPIDDYENTRRELLMSDGETFFGVLLLKLSPLLETPLTVLALGSAGGTSWASALTVGPGGEKVEMLELNG